MKGGRRVFFPLNFIVNQGKRRRGRRVLGKDCDAICLTFTGGRVKRVEGGGHKKGGEGGGKKKKEGFNYKHLSTPISYCQG